VNYFFLPGNTPHSPIRGENTVGLVIEKVRKGTDLVDGLMWFCENCNHPLQTYRFPLQILKQILSHALKNFMLQKKCENVKNVEQ
jgi:3-hydroxyanthranilic acid dioxygenase.